MAKEPSTVCEALDARILAKKIYIMYLVSISQMAINIEDSIQVLNVSIHINFLGLQSCYTLDFTLHM